MSTDRRKHVLVVGAGLGGISAAISLRQAGYRVTVLEKNAHLGGKLNELRAQGFTFDLGPSILTMPHIFERLFTGAGRRMADYISIRPLRPHWRNFFEDGVALNLYPEPERQRAELEKIGEDPHRFARFLDYANRLFDLINFGYFEQGLDTFGEFTRCYGLRRFPQFDLLRTMHDGVARHLREPHVRDMMDFFIKYVGSSAYRAPAFMNCLPAVQFRHDLWYVDGGLYGLARGLACLMAELEISVHLETEVAQLRTEGRRVTGAVTRDGTFHPADIVVSNMEVIPAYRRLLGESDHFFHSLRRFAPACSGLVIDLGLDRTYPQLAHHNFFHSKDQRRHFDHVFRKGLLPDDPTVYVVAASRSDPSVAPPGCDGLKILPHIPPLDEKNPVAPEQYLALKDRVLAKLERMGLQDLRRHIVFEHFWTPHDIERMYYSNRGAIYGVVVDRWKNLGFKAPKHSAKYDNLFFVGGSVNPGGGMPMVVLSGQNAARAITQWDRS